MDVLNKAFAQAADLFKSLSPGARLCAGLLLVVTTVSVGYLFVDPSSGGDGYLMGGEMFSAGQLRGMHAALGKAGLEARIDGARIKVGHGQESKCMAALAEAGALPVEFGGYLEKALATNNFMTLSRNQDAAMKIAKQRELQNIINTMVDKSLVLIDEHSDHGFPPKTIITASVSIQPRERQPLDENRIPAAIRYLVASSVAGLKPEAVTVVDLSTQRTYPGTGGGENPAPGTLGEYAELKRYYEREYQEKISRLLAPHIPGALVTTSVELDVTALGEQPSGGYDPAHVADADERAPRPIQVVNSLEEPADAAPPTLKQPGARGARHKPSDDALQAPKRHTISGERTAPRDSRVPRRVAVSIAVPSTHYERVWRQTTLAAADDPTKKPDAGLLAAIQATEKKKIEELVNPLLPKADAADAGGQVVVSTFYQTADELPRESTLEENALVWVKQNSNTLGLAGLALFGLIVLRWMIRSVQAPTTPLPSPSLELSSPLALDAELASRQPLEGPPAPHIRTRGRGPSLRDELSEIVRDDPEAAVSILRNWIGNA